MFKKKGRKAYEKGTKLESRVASWLQSQFGYKCIKRELARGLITKRPYEVDIHASKKVFLGFGGRDVWAESKAYKIKRTHVTKLVESARDVRDAHEEEIEDWHPNMLMLVSNKGFDVDAIGMADKYRIYCVKAGERSFQFVGRMDREDFEDGEDSNY